MAEAVEWRCAGRVEWDWELMGVIHVLTANRGGCPAEQHRGGSLGHRPGHSDAGGCGWEQVGAETQPDVLQADWWSLKTAC